VRRRDVPRALFATTAAGIPFIASRAMAPANVAPNGPQTAAELRAGVSPLGTGMHYPEGDIRRYGALTQAADNHLAINDAIAVSAAGGNAAFIPGGIWKITAAIAVAPFSSMYGMGNASIIAPQAGVSGLVFSADNADYATAGAARFFRDFQIMGTLTHGTSTNTGIEVNFSVATGALAFTAPVPADSTGAKLSRKWTGATGPQPLRFSNGEIRNVHLTNGGTAAAWSRGLSAEAAAAATYGGHVTAVNFSNIFISNFGTAVYLRQLWDSSFNNCLIVNCYYGFYFFGQSVTNSINDCIIQFVAGGITGNGGSWGISFQSIDGESCENTHIRGGSVYGFSVNINVMLAFELQIEHVDISNAQSVGVDITTINGGCWVRDCWIETNSASPTIGISINPLAVPHFNDIHIVGNHLNCDIPFAGSKGIVVSIPQFAVEIVDNHCNGFDQGITGVAAPYLVIRDNKIKCLTRVYSAASYAIRLNSGSQNNAVGPNAIVFGNNSIGGGVREFFQAARMKSGSVDIGVTASESFPVGTPIQFDASQNGFFVGVTYFVITSGSNVITVGPEAKGTAIAATGAALVNVLAAPLPLTFSDTTPLGLFFYGAGRFIMRLSGGFSTPPTGVIDWVANGSQVSIKAGLPSLLSGATTAASMAGSGLPQFLLPVTEQHFQATVINDGTPVYGMASLTAAGTLTFFTTPANGAFTPSGIKGVGAFPMTWLYT
jgi:hypothetical protein